MPPSPSTVPPVISLGLALSTGPTLALLWLGSQGMRWLAAASVPWPGETLPPRWDPPSSPGASPALDRD